MSSLLDRLKGETVAKRWIAAHMDYARQMAERLAPAVVLQERG